MKALYFSHDCNARNDPKILMMRSIYGYEGYGWYWAIIEMMREQSDYKINISSEMHIGALAMHLGCERITFAKFIQDCIDINLFDSDGVNIWTQSLMDRMQKMNEKSAKASKSAQARWKKNEVEKVEVEELPVDDGLKKVSQYVQHNGFGMLNSKIANEIIEYLDDGIEPDLIIQAINIAIDNNARNWGYCKACIDKWLDKGIKTVEQYNAEDIKYKAEKQSKQRYSVPQKQSILERLGGVDHEQDGNVQAICCD